MFKGEEAPFVARLVEIGRLAILSDMLSGGQTGIVVAGFGRKDMFPTLVSYEIDGMVSGKLKLYKAIMSTSIARGTAPR